MPADTVLELARLLSAEAIDVGPLGHTQAAVSAVNVPQVLAFLDEHQPA